MPLRDRVVLRTAAGPDNAVTGRQRRQGSLVPMAEEGHVLHVDSLFVWRSDCREKVWLSLPSRTVKPQLLGEVSLGGVPGHTRVNPIALVENSHLVETLSVHSFGHLLRSDDVAHARGERQLFEE